MGYHHGVKGYTEVSQAVSTTASGTRTACGCAEYSRDISQMLGGSHFEVFPDLPDHWKKMLCR